MMAVGVLQLSVASILDNEDFELNCPQMKIDSEEVKKLLEVSSSDDRSQDVFVKFAVVLHDKLEALATPSSSVKLMSTQRRQL